MLSLSISDEKKERTVIVACRIMEPELEYVRQRNNHVEICYIDQGLHRMPKNMAGLVQEQIDQAAAYATRIVLG